MRGNEDQTSSFDLFLDTICNTFGGIVFLAILLAIMIQNRSIVRTVEQLDQQPSPEEVRALITKLDKLSSEHTTLQTSLENLPAVAPHAEDEEYLTLAEQVKKMEEKVAERVAMQTRASRSLAEIVEENAIQQQENERVPAQLENAENKLDEATAEFERLLASKKQTLRLPKVRTSSTASALLVVKDASIFLARTPSLFAQGFNTKQVTTTTLPDGGIRIEPLAGTGWRLGSGQGSAEFEKVIQQARQSGHILSIAVWPESYGEFAVLREAMIAAGVNYQLWPQSQGEALVVYFGSGASTIQ